MNFCSQLSQSLFGSQPHQYDGQGQFSQGSCQGSQLTKTQQPIALQGNNQSQQSNSQSQPLCIDTNHLPPKSSSTALSKYSGAFKTSLSACNSNPVTNRYSNELGTWVGYGSAFEEESSSRCFFKIYHELPAVLSTESLEAPYVSAKGEERKWTACKELTGFGEAMKDLYSQIDKLDDIPALKATVESFMKKTDPQFDSKDMMCRLREMSDHLALQSKMIENLLNERNRQRPEKSATGVETQTASSQTSPMSSPLAALAEDTPALAEEKKIAGSVKDLTEHGIYSQNNQSSKLFDEAKEGCGSSPLVQVSRRYALRSAEKNSSHRNGKNSAVFVASERRINSIKVSHRNRNELRRSPRLRAKHRTFAKRELLPSPSDNSESSYTPDRMLLTSATNDSSTNKSATTTDSSGSATPSSTDDLSTSCSSSVHRTSVPCKTARKVTFSPTTNKRHVSSRVDSHKKEISVSQKPREETLLRMKRPSGSHKVCQRHREKIRSRKERKSKHSDCHGNPKTSQGRCAVKSEPREATIKRSSHRKVCEKNKERKRNSSHSYQSIEKEHRMSQSSSHSGRNTSGTKHKTKGWLQYTYGREHRTKQSDGHRYQRREVKAHKPGILKKPIDDDISVLSMSAFGSLFNEE